MTPNVRRHAKVCERCDNDFVAANSNARFCSDNCRKRTAAERNRASCADCGTLLREGSGWGSRRARRCVDCHTALETERIAQRDREFAALWAEGKKLREIADHFGWTFTHASVELHHARERGADLPYRLGHHKNEPRFPEQVAA